MPCCCRIGGPSRSLAAILLSGAPLLLLVTVVSGMLVSGGKLRMQGPIWGHSGRWGRRSVTMLPLLPPCFQHAITSRKLPSQHRQRQQQEHALGPFSRNLTLFCRSSGSKSSRKYPRPLSASDIGALGGGPLVSSVFLTRLSRLGRPLARKLLPQLAFDNPLMLPSGVGMTALMQFVEQQKVLHKEHVILTQVKGI